MSFCQLPSFSFGFSLPVPSFTIPSLPSFSFSLSIPCPLD
jgi:hypothetical protein